MAFAAPLGQGSVPWHQCQMRSAGIHGDVVNLEITHSLFTAYEQANI